MSDVLSSVGSVELILVRHGLPDWAPDTFARNDPNLSDLGRQQAERLAARFEAWGYVDEIWASPMRRSQETASPLAAVLGTDIKTLDWAHEIRNPDDWEGMPIDDIRNAWVDANLRPLKELWEGMPGGEDFRDFHQRVVGGLEASLAEKGLKEAGTDPRLWTIDNLDDEYRIVLVAHGGTNAVVLGHLLGMAPTPWEWDRFELPHTGVARVVTLPIAHAHAFSLRVFADTTHLEPEMVTK